MKDIRKDWITLDNVVWEEEIRRLRMVEYAVSPSLFAFGFNIILFLRSLTFPQFSNWTTAAL